ncbi:hypothetical protein Salat_0642500 [Sesamum alatum]|uniref:Uncharacterized protein n=1 Tax=Sesamum alatum TaxID=300844 RepID=A0AAE2CU84_9LAMI|nr:hypothetical protein Salat_0642500 [Sesamum alatum]
MVGVGQAMSARTRPAHSRGQVDRAPFKPNSRPGGGGEFINQPSPQVDPHHSTSIVRPSSHPPSPPRTHPKSDPGQTTNGLARQPTHIAPSPTRHPGQTEPTQPLTELESSTQHPNDTLSPKIPNLPCTLPTHSVLPEPAVTVGEKPPNLVLLFRIPSRQGICDISSPPSGASSTEGLHLVNLVVVPILFVGGRNRGRGGRGRIRGGRGSLRLRGSLKRKGVFSGDGSAAKKTSGGTA